MRSAKILSSLILVNAFIKIFLFETDRKCIQDSWFNIFDVSDRSTRVNSTAQISRNFNVCSQTNSYRIGEQFMKFVHGILKRDIRISEVEVQIPELFNYKPFSVVDTEVPRR